MKLKEILKKCPYWAKSIIIGLIIGLLVSVISIYSEIKCSKEEPGFGAIACEMVFYFPTMILGIILLYVTKIAYFYLYTFRNFNPGFNIYHFEWGDNIFLLRLVNSIILIFFFILIVFYFYRKYKKYNEIISSNLSKKIKKSEPSINIKLRELIRFGKWFVILGIIVTFIGMTLVRSGCPNHDVCFEITGQKMVMGSILIIVPTLPMLFIKSFDYYFIWFLISLVYLFLLGILIGWIKNKIKSKNSKVK